jgi:hypothetical protein
LFYSILFSLISSVFISGRFCWQEDRDQCQGIKRKKCRHCQLLFIPNPRNKDRQNYCRQPACRARPTANLAGCKSHKIMITSRVSNAGVPSIRVAGAANPETGAMRYKIP